MRECNGNGMQAAASLPHLTVKQPRAKQHCELHGGARGRAQVGSGSSESLNKLWPLDNRAIIALYDFLNGLEKQRQFLFLPEGKETQGWVLSMQAENSACFLPAFFLPRFSKLNFTFFFPPKNSTAYFTKATRTLFLCDPPQKFLSQDVKPMPCTYVPAAGAAARCFPSQQGTTAAPQQPLCTLLRAGGQQWHQQTNTGASPLVKKTLGREKWLWGNLIIFNNRQLKMCTLYTGLSFLHRFYTETTG